MSPLLKKSKGVNISTTAKYCIISGVLALFIMLFTYLCHSNTLLFGKNTVLRMDLYHQYGPLYSELYDRITSGSSLTYSWTSGLGGGFLGNLFNYCCSPFALVMLILGHKNMPEAIAIMIMLKAVLSSVSFTYYLNKTKAEPNKLSIGFGLLYAFCGYFVAYSWNIMWLDAMCVFPFVILGLEKIINKKKPALFIASLTYTMITNYYMAYMVCILACIYFLYYYFCNYSMSDKLEKKAAKVLVPASEFIDGGVDNPLPMPAASPVKKKTKLSERRFFVTGCIFAISGVLCFLLAAFALIPVVYSLETSSATSSTFPEKIKIYFKFFDFLANHLPSVTTTIRSSGEDVLPNVYCGVLSVILLPFYFMSNRISGKKKIAAVSILSVFYLAFSVNYFNYIWHGFHFPNDLPYRFSFAYSFILLILVYEVIKNIDEFTRKNYVTAGVALLLFVVIAEKVGSKNVIDRTIYFSIIFTVFYVVVFGLFSSSRYSKKVISTLLIFLIVVELCFCNTANYTMNQPKKAYASDYVDYRSISEQVEKNDTDLFYRTELSKLRARMDPCWYNYRGVSTFSSMAYEHTSALMKSLGLFGNRINSYTYYPQTPIFNSFFALKYIYDNNDYLSENSNYSLVASNDIFDAYSYKYNLPIGFSVSDGIKDWDTSSPNPFNVQNYLVEKSTGIGDVLEKVNATDVELFNIQNLSLDTINSAYSSFYVYKNDSNAEGTVKVKIDVEKAGDYYVYTGGLALSRLQITAEDFKYDYVSSSIQPITMGVGYQPEGQEIVIEYTVDKAKASGDLYFFAVRVDETKFNAAYNQIKSNGTLELQTFDESKFTGKINVTNTNGFMFTSIPYDTSWVINVDGTPLKYYNKDTDGTSDGKIISVGNGLIGFSLSKGEHDISFEYVPKGLTTGIIMTVFGILILAAYILLSSFMKKKKQTESAVLEQSSEAENENTENFTELNEDFFHDDFENSGLVEDGSTEIAGTVELPEQSENLSDETSDNNISEKDNGDFSSEDTL